MQPLFASAVTFYILGLGLAGWAVLLFAVGMLSPTFPSTAAAQRGVTVLSLVLVVATMVAAVATA